LLHLGNEQSYWSHNNTFGLLLIFRQLRTLRGMFEYWKVKQICCDRLRFNVEKIWSRYSLLMVFLTSISVRFFLTLSNEISERLCHNIVLICCTSGKTRRCEPGSVRQCGLKSVPDRLYSRYCADMDVKWIKLSLSNNNLYHMHLLLSTLLIPCMCCNLFSGFKMDFTTALYKQMKTLLLVNQLMLI